MNAQTEGCFSFLVEETELSWVGASLACEEVGAIVMAWIGGVSSALIRHCTVSQTIVRPDFLTRRITLMSLGLRDYVGILFQCQLAVGRAPL